MEFDIIEIRPNVFHVDYPTQYQLTSTFMRLQEFYESPYDDIRGHFFTHEQYMDRYAEDRGKMSYFTDWSGFNVPSSAISLFMDKFGYSLNVKENALMVPLMSMVAPRLEANPNYRYYLIGTYGMKTDTINHELCHAYWFIDPEYRQQKIALIEKHYPMGSEEYKSLADGLIELGYADDEEILDDEIQAFASTKGTASLINTLGLNDDFVVPKDFKNHFNEYDESIRKEFNEGVLNE